MKICEFSPMTRQRYEWVAPFERKLPVKFKLVLVSALFAFACTPPSPEVSFERRTGPAAQTFCNDAGGLHCGKDQYCHFEKDGFCGMADNLGVCKQRPEMCIDVFEPVCGCDGKTYFDPCEAHMAGTSVDHEGNCKVEGEETACNEDVECLKTEFCSLPEAAVCGVNGMPGVCAPKPILCGPTVALVCGCDGQTYRNFCEAAAAGTSVTHEGECAAPLEKACGGVAGFPCTADEYCHFEPELACGKGGSMGVCREVEIKCGNKVQPVCGCDGKTYDNMCLANANRTSVLHKGMCK